MMSGGGGTALGSIGAGGIGAGLSDLLGGSATANTIGQIGNAQLAQQQSTQQQAVSLAAPTAAEIQQLQQAMGTNAQAITQSQQLIGSADPALMAAGQQALALMNGGSAASLAPIQNQRAQQRAQLQQQLQQQLGPGYATSTAGIQALNNFDQQTANLMTNAQQQTIQNYLGVSQGAAGLGAQQQQQGIANSGSLAAMQGNLTQNQIAALQNNPVNPGLAYSGQLAQNSANQQNMGTIFGWGTNNAGMINSQFQSMFGGGGGGSGLPATSNTWSDVANGTGTTLGGPSAGAGEGFSSLAADATV